MDPVAMAAATLVAKWAAEGMVKEAAKSAWEGMRNIYDAIRGKLSGDPESTSVLQRLEQKPNSEGRRQELAEVLDERIKGDPDFARRLRDLIDKTGTDPALATFVTEVMDNAKVGKITNIGSVHGDVHF